MRFPYAYWVAGVWGLESEFATRVASSFIGTPCSRLSGPRGPPPWELVDIVAERSPCSAPRSIEPSARPFGLSRRIEGLAKLAPIVWIAGARKAWLSLSSCSRPRPALTQDPPEGQETTESRKQSEQGGALRSREDVTWKSREITHACPGQPCPARTFSAPEVEAPGILDPSRMTR